MLAFPIGMLLSLNIDKIRKLLSSKLINAIVSSAFLIVGLGVYAFIHFSEFNYETLPTIAYNSLSVFTCVFVAVGVIGFTYLFKFLQNKFMTMLSAFTMEVYLLHGYLLNYEFFISSYLGIVLLVVSLIASTIAMHYLCQGITRFIKRIFKRKENA